MSGSNVNIDANRMSAAENLEFFIENNRFINGIEKNREEYTISQYADDKPLFTNGSQKSLDGILRTFFAYISGMRNNFNKIKIIWMGNITISIEIIHQSQWKFKSVHTQCNLLNMKFLNK